jgi:hypothetical protein
VLNPTIVNEAKLAFVAGDIKEDHSARNFLRTHGRKPAQDIKLLRLLGASAGGFLGADLGAKSGIGAGLIADPTALSIARGGLGAGIGYTGGMGLEQLIDDVRAKVLKTKLKAVKNDTPIIQHMPAL